jgi:hypothetical protein
MSNVECFSVEVLCNLIFCFWVLCLDRWNIYKTHQGCLLNIKTFPYLICRVVPEKNELPQAPQCFLCTLRQATIKHIRRGKCMEESCACMCKILAPSLQPTNWPPNSFLFVLYFCLDLFPRTRNCVFFMKKKNWYLGRRIERR